MGERRVPKPNQQAALWEESAADKKIEAAILAVQDAQNNRMSWQRQEMDARAALAELLTEGGFTIESGYKRGHMIAWLEPGATKVKVRVEDPSEE